MTLFEGTKNQVFRVRNLYIDEKTGRRLQALGFNDGIRVKVLNRKKNGAMIIAVRGTRLALGRRICHAIEVIPVPDDDGTIKREEDRYEQ